MAATSPLVNPGAAMQLLARTTALKRDDLVMMPPNRPESRESSQQTQLHRIGAMRQKLMQAKTETGAQLPSLQALPHNAN